MRVLAAVALLGTGACGGGIHAGRVSQHPPIPPATFWAGLPPPKTTVEDHAIAVLRPPLEGRVPLPAGTFLMGSTPLDVKRALVCCQSEPSGALCDLVMKQLIESEQPAHPVTLSAFAIDRTEVTVAAYERCVEVGQCRPRTHGLRDPRFDRPDLPVTFVDWNDANTYCKWAGGRLPTEAEWEYAARGVADRTYPWGKVYNPFLANHGSFSDEIVGEATDRTDGFEGLAPVGSFPDGATPEGVLDLAGNAAEWVADFFLVSDGNTGYPPGAAVDPKGPSAGPFHVVRGGSYETGAFQLRGAARCAFHWRNVRQLFQGTPSPDVGFRCAADVQ